MKLLIVIPALNEEDSIENIIRRTLDAEEHIRANSPVTEIAITVVSDGSTDRTVERASAFQDSIHLIVFPKNRGYGAAIKTGWLESDADLVGFLDADGTCDPRFFAVLCSTLAEQDADVVLGCRINANSEMPALRRVGNLIFATLLSVFADARVRDTASGMRVVRRSSLARLFPLPDGLQFTPAMSARAMLSNTIRIREVDMPYRERVGQSKLSVVKDGVRFLVVILETAFLYKPARPLNIAGAGLFLIAALLMGTPVFHYLVHRNVEEWMIYRFLVSYLFATSAVLLVSAGYITDRIRRIALSNESAQERPAWVERIFRSRRFWLLPCGLVAVGGALVLGSALQLLRTGHTNEHWSRYVAMTLFFSTAIILAVIRGVDYVLSLIDERIRYWNTVESRP
jgi:glycosyltransferase involved in cell wall biosynthesis